MILASAVSPDKPYLFFFNDTATTEIYTLSLHDALPILTGVVEALKAHVPVLSLGGLYVFAVLPVAIVWGLAYALDRKSTRLNSSHSQISYAVFCLKKKNNPK